MYSRASRELLHTERMRSVELGHPLDEPGSVKAIDKHIHNAFWISFWMVVAVPSAAFSSAASATKAADIQAGLAIVIWLFAAAASMTSVVCATVLMIHSRSGQVGELT